MIFPQILWYTILPVFLMLAAGRILDGKFHTNVDSYDKLTTCIILPCYVFYSFYLSFPSLSVLLLFPVMIILALLFYGGVTAIAGRTSASEFSRLFLSFFPISVVVTCLLLPLIPHDLTRPSSYGADIRSIAVSLLVIGELSFLLIRPFFDTKKNKILTVSKDIFICPDLYAVLIAGLLTYASISIEKTFVAPVITHIAGAFLIFISVATGARTRHINKHALSFLLKPVISYGSCLVPISIGIILYFFPALPRITACVSLIFITTAITSTILSYTIVHENKLKKENPLFFPTIIHIIIWLIFAVGTAVFCTGEA